MKRILKYAARVFLLVIITLALLCGGAYGAMWVLAKGPSPTAQRLFVQSVRETSAAKFLAGWYLSEEEIDEIMSSFGGGEEEEVDTSLINIPQKETGNTGESGTETKPDVGEDTHSAESDTENSSGDGDGVKTDETKPDTESETDRDPEDGGITLVDVVGDTYKGIMMIVDDPSRVFIGVPPDGYGQGKSGLGLRKMAQTYGAIAGVNGGGFFDPEGKGTGGIPEGLVIYDGDLLWNDGYSSFSVVGFDKNNILHVGQMTAKKAMELELQYAVSFGPALIINGKPCNEKNLLGGGLNPRTAVGQRADGAILLLVINGRQIDSLGASYDDLVSVMLSFGAVNAGNLDGGSSSLMYYKEDFLTTSAYLFGERIVPNAILVK